MAMTGMDFVKQAKSEIKEVDLNGAAALMDAGVTVLDVREPAEFDAGHLNGAVNLPRGVLEFRGPEHPALQDKEKEILIYCKTGGRGALATLTLGLMGYKAVNMLGGFDAWAENGNDVAKDPNVC